MSYPSPFQSRTDISLTPPADQVVRLTFVGVDGRLVRTLAQGLWPAGNHLVLRDGRDQKNQPAAAGQYLLRLESGGVIETRRTARLR